MEFRFAPKFPEAVSGRLHIRYVRHVETNNTVPERMDDALELQPPISRNYRDHVATADRFA